MSAYESLDLDETPRLYFRAAFAACVLVYSSQQRKRNKRWTRTWSVAEGFPPVRMLLAAWTIAERWKVCAYLHSREAGEQISHFLHGDRRDTLLQTVDRRLKEMAQDFTLIEQHGDLYSRKTWYYVRPCKEAHEYLKLVRSQDPDVATFADLVAKEYRLHLEADSRVYTSALQAWGDTRWTKQKTPET